MTAILESNASPFRSSINIPVETRAQMVDLLHLRLSDSIKLQTAR